MGLMDKLGETLTNLLFEPEGEKAGEGGDKEEKGQEAEKAAAKPQPVKPDVPASSTASSSTDSVEKYRKALLDSVQKGKQPSDVVCIPFIKTIKSLEPTIMDEATRFRVAFTSGDAFGINVQSVVASGQALKAALSQEEKKFNDTLEREAVSKVKEEETEVAGIEQALEEKNASIQKLMKEIEDLKGEKTSKLAEINEARIKIETIRRDFTQASQILANELDEVVRKANIYGGKADGSK